jgi:hypothetical protein
MQLKSWGRLLKSEGLKEKKAKLILGNLVCV